MFKNIHLPRYERIWLTIGIISLLVFRSILVTLAIVLEMQPAMPGFYTLLPPLSFVIMHWVIWFFYFLLFAPYS